MTLSTWVYHCNLKMLIIKLSLFILMTLSLASDLKNSSKEAIDETSQKVKTTNTEISTNAGKIEHYENNTTTFLSSGYALSSTGEYRYDPLTVKKIDEALGHIFDANLSLIMGFYIYNRSFDDLHERVMDGIRQINEDNLDIDFYSKSFASQLNSLLKYSFDSLNKRATFWHDLFRLLFKWTLFMRQKFADNDDAFEEIAIDAETLYFTVISRNLSVFDFQIPKYASTSPLNPKKFDFSIFHTLIKYELLEDINIFSTFNLVLSDFYGHGNGEKKFSCQELRIEYFNGNFNNNKLLELMLLIYDHRGNIKTCLLQNNSAPKLFPDLTFEESTLDGFPQKIKIPIRKAIENLEVRYMSIPIAEFFLDNDLHFQIRNSTDLVVILKMLTEADFLSKKPLSEFITFMIHTVNNDVAPEYRWSQLKFKLFMEQQKEKGFTKDEYINYIGMA